MGLGLELEFSTQVGAVWRTGYRGSQYFGGMGCGRDRVVGAWYMGGMGDRG